MRNNGGGHANHTLFWEIALPERRRRADRRARRGRRRRRSASFDVLKQQMVDAGIKRFGSGWSWLVWDGTGLAVLSTPNQDSPVIGRQDAALRHRRLGARLLPQVPEPPPGVPRGDLERRRLERGRRPVRRGAIGVGPRANPATRSERIPCHGRGDPRTTRLAPSPESGQDLRGEPGFAHGRRADRPRAGGDRPRVRGAPSTLREARAGIALRRMGDRGRAEDATQDTFAKPRRSAARFDPTRGQGDVAAFTVARDAIVDGLRRRPEATVGGSRTCPSPARPDDAAESEWASWRVHRALDDAARPGRSRSSPPTGAASCSPRSPTTSAFRLGRSRRGRDWPCAGSWTS